MRRIKGIGQKRNLKEWPSRCFFCRKSFLIILISSITFLTFGQNKDNWTLYRDQNGIKIFTQYDEFHDNANGLHYEYVILKIENYSSKDKKINLSKVLYYDGKRTSDDDNAVYTLHIKSGVTVSGNVSGKSDETLRIFRRFLNYTDKPVLTGFDLIINAEDL